MTEHQVDVLHRANHINIRINSEHYQVDVTSMTGLQIKQLAGIAAGNHLFVDTPGNGDDEQILDDRVVELRSGMAFYDVPVGNLG
mgnify:CR=1 FL=1